MRRTPPLIALVILAPVGCNRPAAAPPAGPVVVVTASYPHANAVTVADTVAGPLEEQVIGAEGLVRVESESHDEGRYVARLRFARGTDPAEAVVVIQNRIALAHPLLPDGARQPGPSVQTGAAADDPGPVAVALIDRGGHGRPALQRWAAAVVGRLAADGAMLDPKAFPRPDETRVVVQIDWRKCARMGLTRAAVEDAVRAAGPAPTSDALNRLTVQSPNGAVPLAAVATAQEETGPVTVYRVNLSPAVRVTGSPPEGRTAAQAARRCVELAEAEMRSLPDGFAVIDLTGR